MAGKTGSLPDEDTTSNRDELPGWQPGVAIDSRLLLGASNTVMIRHAQEFYTLRETRAGKLILTK